MKSLDPFEISFSGTHLIEASAGTGKTYNIASLYIRALIETDKTIDEILVVTYTEAATKELRNRLMKRLREATYILKGEAADDDSFLLVLQQHVVEPDKAIEKLQRAIHSFDEAAIYTIHGFCRHALQEQAFRSGAPFEVELIGDDSEITGEIIDDYWRKWVEEASENMLRRPLLKLMLDKGYNPEKLTDELASYVGKPYLEIVPGKISINIEKYLDKIGKLFSTLKKEWLDNREKIFRLLDAGHLSYYRTDWIESWMQSMDEWLQADVSPIACFDKFSRFSQSHIDNSLKKASRNKGIAPPQHDFFQLVDSYQEVAQALQNFDVVFKRDLFTHVINKLSDKKEDLQVYSYDDLLIQLRNALYHPQRGEGLRQKLRQKYSAALVDEFQDTDPIQYQIFKAIYKGAMEAAVFMIGDPKQSIYSFRGADIFAYLKAKEDAPAENIFSLSHNYRSVPSLINGFNALFGFHRNPFILENIGYQPVQPGLKSSARFQIGDKEAVPLEIRNLDLAEDEDAINKKRAKKRSADDTANQIYKLLSCAQKGEALIGEEPVQAKDIAVLVRSHNQATLISDALQARGIKSVKHSRESVFYSDEARELYIVLKAVAEPGDERLVITALSTAILGYTASQLFGLKENESKWAGKLEQFSEWHALWEDYGIARMFRQFMQEEEVAENVMLRADGERVLTNLNHLSELIQHKEQQEKPGMHSLLKWLLKKRNEDQKEIEEEQLRLESDENLVSVVTMHHSKGLEYPIVFCPFLWHAPRQADYGKPVVYHDPDDPSKAYLDLRGKNDAERSKKRFLQAKEELSEGVRLAYVAVTRAKYKCVINWVHAKKSVHSPLGLLLLGTEEAFKSLQSDIFSDFKYDGSNKAQIHQQMEKLAKHDAISVSEFLPSNENIRRLDANEEQEMLQAATFSRSQPLARGPGMSSFSALVHHEHEEFEPDYRQYFDDILTAEEEEKEAEGQSIFSFPKGPGPGTAVHHIFENIDFTDSQDWDSVINEQLRAQNILDHWKNVVRKMLHRTVDKNLTACEPTLKLSSVEPKKMIPEMEFYFKNDRIVLRDLLQIIRPSVSISNVLNGFAEQGFLKGFIDLTFQFNEKFYILDYKTNYLGNEISDYDKDKLHSEIEEKIYDLQYHLYLVALHQFLKNRYPGYNFDNHIGGVIYLFIRGVNEHGDEGIYFDRPPAGRIKKLDKYLERNEDD